MQQPTPVTSTLISSSSSFTSSLPQIPQFIVIHDKSQQNWKHPIVHYIFEDEIIPINITQEHCILVGLSEDGEKVENMCSLSHNFQITGYKISSTPQMNSNNNNSISSNNNNNNNNNNSSSTNKESSGLMLTIEGMSKTDNNNNLMKIKNSQFGIKEEESSNVFRLDELVYEFKKRNELLRQTIEFSQN